MKIGRQALATIALHPALASKINELKNELTSWVKSQNDERLPHLEPYLRTQPLPELKPR